MPDKVWTQALSQCADAARATRVLDQLRSTEAAKALAEATPEAARVLAALLGGSQFLGEWLLKRPEWVAIPLNLEALAHPRQASGLKREVETLLAPALRQQDDAGALGHLREFKQREMLRIASRDLARLGQTLDIIREISQVADVCLDAVCRICRRQLETKLGRPFHLDADGAWQPTEFCVLGMGKLGGIELNYSSDVDVLFVYSEEGAVFKTPPKPGDAAPAKAMSSHAFFLRLSEAIIAEVTRLTPQGTLFRIDLRLRPEGQTGPLARSLSSYENYYAQWGQTWERMMLVKTRCVAGDPGLGFEFVEMIQPFRYARSVNDRIFREVSAMKQRIETEVVKSGEIDRNVKLGHGGIREIEFIVQTLQVLHGGRTPFLQNAQTVPVLDKLAQYQLLKAEDAGTLAKAYVFLRDVEHRLQMEADQQTHTIPTSRPARERLARLMGFATLAAFEKALQQHTRAVRRLYETLLGGSDQARPGLDLPEDGDEGATGRWKQLLGDHAFRDPEKAHRLMKIFVHGPGFVHVSSRTEDLARDLIPKLLALCPKLEPGGHQRPGGPSISTEKKPTAHGFLSDPDRVLARLDSFITAYGARATLYEIWNSHPTLFELMLLLFDRSEFLAEIAIRTPDLVDELVTSERLRRQKTAEIILKELRLGLDDKDQKLWLRRYHQTELMRLGLRDILGLSDYEQNLAELSALAEACLQYALEVALRQARLTTPPFCILGLGKLGGAEIDYGSDLDVIFVAGPKPKNLSRLQPLASTVMDLLSAQTETGATFEVDARLRPDGEKGLLVNTLPACENYYRQRALLWEIQSLSRARPVAGDLALGGTFMQFAVSLADFRKTPPLWTGFKPGWRTEITRMRERIEKERTPRGKDDIAFKTGLGGLMDAEFMAQAWCLENGWHEPNTRRALERAVAAGLLQAADGQALLESYGHLRRMEGILRRWSFAGESTLPDDPAPMFRVAVRCGFRNAAEFMLFLKQHRARIREIYHKVLA